MRSRSLTTVLALITGSAIRFLNRLLGCISVVTLTDLVSVWRFADQYVIGMAGQCVRSAKLVLGLRSLFEFRLQLNLGKNCRGIHNYASI